MTAKTIITAKEGWHITDPIEYTFKNDQGDVRKVEADNYRQARRKLNKITGNKPGYKLTQRLL